MSAPRNLAEALERIADLEQELALYRPDDSLRARIMRAIFCPVSGRPQRRRAALLAALYRAAGRFIEPGTLADMSDMPTIDTVRVQVLNLRKRLGADAIETCWNGTGYRLTHTGRAAVDRLLADASPQEAAR